MKIFCQILVFIFITSCAQPKYVQQNSDASANTPLGQEQKWTCDTKFGLNGTCLLLYWEKKPVSTADEGVLILKTYRLNLFDQTPVEVNLSTLGQVALKLWMPSMGHGSSPTLTTELDVGTYRVSQVYFIMPGDWQFLFQIKNGSTVIDESQVPITINF